MAKYWLHVSLRGHTIGYTLCVHTSISWTCVCVCYCQQLVVCKVVSISLWAQRVCSLTCDSQWHWHIPLSLWFPFPSGRPMRMHPSLLAACENTGVTDPRIHESGSGAPGVRYDVLLEDCCHRVTHVVTVRSHCTRERGRPRSN